MDTSNETRVASVWRTLRFVVGVVPLVAGLDKFLNLLVHWPKYLAPAVAAAVPLPAQRIMYIVGAVEIVAGLGVLFSPWSRAFGYVVAAWLTGVSVNLIAGGFYDIAVRDLVMAVSAFAFARLYAVVPHARHVRHSMRHAHAGV